MFRPSDLSLSSTMITNPGNNQVCWAIHSINSKLSKRVRKPSAETVFFGLDKKINSILALNPAMRLYVLFISLKVDTIVSHVSTFDFKIPN